MRMAVTSMFAWRSGTFEPIEYCDMTLTTIAAADSFLVEEGMTLAAGLHRARFLSALGPDDATQADASEFWDAAIAAIPADGAWFPRVEAHASGRLVFRLRSAPERTRSVVLGSWTGRDPRTQPRTKGPDLESMLRIRTAVQPTGAEEAVLLSPDGYVVEGAYSGLLWWRGDIMCGPPADLARIDSVTTRTVLTLATALGLDTLEEAVTPAELDGTELWSLGALHGVRIATRWIDGPQLAERPGRLAQWRARLDALRRQIR